MGTYYSVAARFGVKNRRSASAAIRNYIHQHDGVDCDFALNDWCAEDVSVRTFDGLMRIVFAGWKSTEFGVCRESGFSVYTNAFQASYGWENVMLDVVDLLKPFLKSKSSIRIWCDGGSHVIEV